MLKDSVSSKASLERFSLAAYRTIALYIQDTSSYVEHKDFTLSLNIRVGISLHPNNSLHGPQGFPLHTSLMVADKNTRTCVGVNLFFYSRPPLL